ncbi:MAG: FAD-dependent oxidoreductase [Candidatus Omnitrophica bacterium]|nr:FAD-dependent oxidoreductase [Candidatus Omnitrophota bacterium]
MSEHDRFRFHSLDELKQKIDELGLDIPTSDDFSILAEPVSYGSKMVPNRLACHPMEGCDGLPNGAPSDLTLRRYKRFGAGGAGLIWGEACAITPESRANPRQLWIHDETVNDFRRMVELTREEARKSMDHDPFLVLQLTHSGRYSRPVKKPAPIIAHHSEILDPKHNLPPDYPLITDEELDRLQDIYVQAAEMAREAGFDAVDIKSCHRYLMSELLASHTRENSRYGGPFENRVRLLLETVAKIRKAMPDFEVTSRLNVYDAISYPYGWGVDRDDYRKPDLTEPKKLVGLLQDLGYHGINVTIANPYFNPHYGRPYDHPIVGGYPPKEHPLEGVERMLRMAEAIQKSHPDLTIVGTGYSWLRHYVPYFAAGTIKEGWNSIVGLGRGGFAYPDFAHDILKKGGMAPMKVCITCSSCTQIMRDHGRTGCVVRDPDVYEEIYKEGRWHDPAVIREHASKCLGCNEPTCRAHCPAGIDIPAFLEAVSKGEDREAYRILRRANILPEICGYVCPVEVQCEGHCVQKYMNEAVSIARIQRFIAEKAVSEGWTALDMPDQVSGKRVAVIGAGPAGLSCAAELLEQGHQVVVIDRGSRPGGKASSVIPSKRLPESEAQAEIHAVFKPISTDRIEWRWNTSLGPDYVLGDIRGEGFDAVALTFGLGNTTSLQREKPNPEGVMDALSFLEHMNRNPNHRVHGKAAVIGGGNTAVDAALAADLGGAEDVYLIYRRSFAEMPAWPKERDEAVKAGVHLLLLTQPVDYEADAEGRVKAVRVVRTELGAPDESGRRRPVAIPDSEHSIPVSMVIEAIGETMTEETAKVLHPIQLTQRGLIRVDQDAWMTSERGVFAAGDLVNGGTTVVQAIAEGRKMAQSINRFLLSVPAS